MISGIPDNIFKIRSEEEFLDLALVIFDYQCNNNKVLKEFTGKLGRGETLPRSENDITYLPVEFFRDKKVVTGDHPEEMIFRSSGTTGYFPGRHYVTNLRLYETSFYSSFRLFYGEPDKYIIAALLPSYVEREGSSLVYMADRLIKMSNHPLSGFYRGKPDKLLRVVEAAASSGRQMLLLGVSFALLELAEEHSPDLSGAVIMETGGMKGRRKEITREELHAILKERFNVGTIHSEYGMTELLSQAYSKGDGIFYCPPWMKIVLRDPQDPLTLLTEPGKTGGINIIDLANVNSCSFISTGDLGKVYEDGGFEVLGRFDSSDIRGCNLLMV
jgi:phenylacetate-coenzyme A ligase PaaK-like adenylate-forming protein